MKEYKPSFRGVGKVLEGICSLGNCCTISEVHKTGIYSYANLTKVFKYISGRNLIQGVPKDGRSINYSLTEKGARILEAYRIISEEERA